MVDSSFNYFGIIKKCSTKLDLEVPATFVAASDDEYVKLKESINAINRLIVLSEVQRWTFRDQEQYITLGKDDSSYPRPNGMITSIRYEVSNDSKGQVLSQPLIPEYRWNYLNKASGVPNRYNLYGEELLVYPTPSDKEVGKRLLVQYATNNCAKTSSGTLKENMTVETDYSLIPTQFSDVLIYGACLDYKAMPDKARYQHYQQMYTNALRQMRRQMKKSIELSPYTDVSGNNSNGDWVKYFFNSWKY